MSAPRIINPKFIGSYPIWKKNATALPQLAIAGRSNVGKSSLINALTGRQNLARASSTPGRTQALVLFEAALRPVKGEDIPFSIVDLPGYGYAKVPLEIKKEWRPMVNSYFVGNERIAACLLLLDSRREPQAEEFDLYEMMADNGVPVIPVITKIDKIQKTKRKSEVARILRALDIKEEGHAFPVSVQEKLGLDPLLSAIEEVLLDPIPESPSP